MRKTPYKYQRAILITAAQSYLDACSNNDAEAERQYGLTLLYTLQAVAEYSEAADPAPVRKDAPAGHVEPAIGNGAPSCAPADHSAPAFLDDRYSGAAHDGSCIRCAEPYRRGDAVWLQNGRCWHQACASDSERIKSTYWRNYAKHNRLDRVTGKPLTNVTPIRGSK